MDRIPAASRDRDPIEAVVYFLFENWVLLVSVPILAGIGAFIWTSVSPQQFNASLRIPSPPISISAFDELWRSPRVAVTATTLANGSVEIRNIGENEASAREPVDALLANIREIASEAAVAVAKRQAALLEFEVRLLAEIADPKVGTLATQAHAFASIMMISEEVNKKASQINTWVHNLSRGKVVVAKRSKHSKRPLLFAVFGGFTMALAIAIGRWLWRRSCKNKA